MQFCMITHTHTHTACRVLACFRSVKHILYSSIPEITFMHYSPPSYTHARGQNTPPLEHPHRIKTAIALYITFTNHPETHDAHNT